MLLADDTEFKQQLNVLESTSQYPKSVQGLPAALRICRAKISITDK